MMALFHYSGTLPSFNELVIISQFGSTSLIHHLAPLLF
ncbi:hypothetical protein E2C01_035843 [Portunus trituberculatus]|uniref:Uncharacterized protein n=1 Tax=Portunus trituberculatus TaxID=210409 RepID=A0A5B7F9J5_PORTR|nr:hypothetical protein [Portunus trituberculatus]